MIIGLAEAFELADFSAYKEAVAFALLFVILLVRPQESCGRKLIQKV
jgi:branched-chain amino acid transport system permease protein